MRLKDIELEKEDDIVGLTTLLRIFKEHREKDGAFLQKRLPSISECYQKCKNYRVNRGAIDGYWYNMLLWITDIKVTFNLAVVLHYYIMLLKQVPKEKLLRETSHNERKFMCSLINLRFVTVVAQSGLVSNTLAEHNRPLREIFKEINLDDLKDIYDKLEYTFLDDYYHYRYLLLFIENENLRDKIPF